MIYIASPEEYLGELLYLQPVYGWGWGRYDGGSSREDHAPIATPSSFSVRVRYILGFKMDGRGGARNVVVGVVELAGHPFDHYWVACSNRLHWRHDFVGRLCLHWDLWLAPSRPHGQVPDRPTGAPAYVGNGILAESRAYIEARFGGG